MKPPVRTPPQAARHQNGIAGMRRGLNLLTTDQ